MLQIIQENCVDKCRSKFNIFSYGKFSSLKLFRMKHIKEINLSKNRLKHFYDLIRLENLHTLDLSENSIIAIANEPIGNDQVNSFYR